MGNYVINHPHNLEVLVRLLLSLLLGAILGIERGRKRRPAGMRTYVIVCMASALVMITGDFLFQKYGTGDPSRLAAQVISGIGFLGAGTIIINLHQVRGLTTAAGLWAAACLGLAVGAGFYFGAVACGLMILLVMTVMQRLEERVRRRSRHISFLGVFGNIDRLRAFVRQLREWGFRVTDYELHRRSARHSDDEVTASFWAELPATHSHEEWVRLLQTESEADYVEELH